MQVFGHRGAAGTVPENSLPSIRAAIAMGVDGVEFDVRLTRDETPILLHDENLVRTTGIKATASHLTIAELDRLVPNRSETIPTLGDALHEIGQRILVNVELKEVAACDATLLALDAQTRAGTIRSDGVLVSSFEHRAIERFRSQTSRYSVGLLTHGIPGTDFWVLAAEVDAVTANIDFPSVHSAFVDKAHSAGLRVMVYTINELADAERMMELGVDAIFSDFPDRVRV